MEGAMGLASVKKISSLPWLNMDLGKTQCVLSFSRTGVFFPSLFIISVSVYTQRNLFVYTDFIRSIPGCFL